MENNPCNITVMHRATDWKPPRPRPSGLNLSMDPPQRGSRITKANAGHGPLAQQKVTSIADFRIASETSKRAIRYQVLKTFFRQREQGESSIAALSRILSQSFSMILPITPYREFPASQIVGDRRKIMGMEEYLKDLKSMKKMKHGKSSLEGFLRGLPRDDPWIDISYDLQEQDCIFEKNKVMGSFTKIFQSKSMPHFSLNLTGMIRCQFNEVYRIVHMDLFYDVHAVVLFLEGLLRAEHPPLPRGGPSASAVALGPDRGGGGGGDAAGAGGGGARLLPPAGAAAAAASTTTKPEEAGANPTGTEPDICFDHGLLRKILSKDPSEPVILTNFYSEQHGGSRWPALGGGGGGAVGEPPGGAEGGGGGGGGAAYSQLRLYPLGERDGVFQFVGTLSTGVAAGSGASPRGRRGVKRGRAPARADHSSGDSEDNAGATTDSESDSVGGDDYDPPAAATAGGWRAGAGRGGAGAAEGAVRGGTGGAGPLLLGDGARCGPPKRGGKGGATGGGLPAGGSGGAEGGRQGTAGAGGGAEAPSSGVSSTADSEEGSSGALPVNSSETESDRFDRFDTTTVNSDENGSSSGDENNDEGQPKPINNNC